MKLNCPKCGNYFEVTDKEEVKEESKSEGSEN